MMQIPGSENWTGITKIEKGWSQDEKYRTLDANGCILLLRLSDAERYIEKRQEFWVISQFARLGFPMSQPLSMGFCDGGRRVYHLLRWVSGQDMETALPSLPRPVQYALGREAGEILRKIHSLPVPADMMPWKTKLPKKQQQLQRYLESELRVPGDRKAVAFIQKNWDAIWTVPPAFLHGDFHPGNLILTPEGRVAVIDFNRWEIGDPYEEFYKLESFGVEASVPYCVGQIDGYFQDQVPEAFWRGLAVYAAHASLFSIVWAAQFGPQDVAQMQTRYHRAMADYDDFQRSVPKWYTEFNRTGR